MIAILVPVLGRPSRVKTVMANVADNTSVAHRLLFVASPTDIRELRALESASADFIVRGVTPPQRGGDYAAKINAGLHATTEPFIFTGADDLRFHSGWDVAALRCMEDPAVGVVGTQDRCNARVTAGLHSTHSLVRRTYADDPGAVVGCPGQVYCEEYPHEFVDDELVATAKSRNAWAFATDSIVEHLHPNCGKGAVDRLYRAAPARMQAGRRIFERRKKLWA